MDRFARLIFAFLCLAPLLAVAAPTYGSVSNINAAKFSDMASACLASGVKAGASSPYNVNAYQGLYYCGTGSNTSVAVYLQSCGPGQSLYLIGTLYGQARYECGSCPSGQTSYEGRCAPTCPASGQQVAPSGTVYEAGNGLSTSLCLAGCEASAFMAATQDGKNYVWGPVVSTGRSCTAGQSTAPSAAESPQKCAVGQCPGTINGQPICVPCSQTKQDTKASSSETSASAASGVTPGPGQTTTQSGSSSTTCAGDTCTTTGQQTVTNPDGSTETKSTTTTQSKGDYCKENPKAGACVGSESTWGGTCQAFTCDGDAVQCAQARGAWELACQLKTEATDPTVQAGTEAMAGTGEAAIKDQLGMNTSQVFDLASRLDSTSLFGTPGACPSDTTLSLGIGSVTLPFASMCPQLNLVGVAMMGLAYLIAAFIVFRPGKGA